MPNPGDLVQMDVKYVPYRIKGQQHYQYTALDDCTRFRFAKIYYELSVNNTEAFFKELLKSIPFKIKTVQTDNGVEFTYRFISDPKCIDKCVCIHTNYLNSILWTSYVKSITSITNSFLRANVRSTAK